MGALSVEPRRRFAAALDCGGDGLRTQRTRRARLGGAWLAWLALLGLAAASNTRAQEHDAASAADAALPPALLQPVPPAQPDPLTGTAPGAPPTTAPPQLAPAIPAPAPGPAASGAPSPLVTPSLAAPAAPVPTAPAPASSPDEPEVKGFDVKLADTLVFTVLRAQGTHSAEERGRAARHALEQALRSDRVDVRAVPQGRAHVLYAGEAPVTELYPEDAEAAGDDSVDVYAARVAARATEVLRTEQKRGDVAEVVMSISLLVLFGLAALMLLRWIGEMADRLRKFLLEHPERIPAIRVKTFEVLGSGPLGSALLAVLIVGRWLVQISVVYVWLVFAFSRFSATRPYTQQLTSFVLTPLSDLAGRLVSALPIALLALVSAALVYVVVRFVELFFGSVGRGETRLAWLPLDLVAPTSLLVRVAIVLLVLVFAGPVVTGDPEGGLARAGSIVMLALALGLVPLLAGVVVGIVQVFARRVRVGQHIGIGELRGRVLSVGLLDVRLQDELGHEVRVPHLLALTKPLRLHSAQQSGLLEISVAPEVSASAARALLEARMREHDAAARVELHDADAFGMHFRVSFATHPERAPSELRLMLVEALRSAGFALGHARERERGRGA